MPVATLRNGKRFEIDTEVSILNAALGQGVFLEYSCRTGRCGACKARIVSGDTVAIQHEESLTTADREAGRVLTCCRSAQTDVTLDLVDLGRLVGQRPKTIPARIAAIELLSPEIVRVSLRFPLNAAIDFLPGQYLDVMTRGVRRSYSIANAPREDRIIDLDIRRFDNGVLSAYWFGEAAAGDLLRVELPLGTFFLRDDLVRTILFLATGTGIAPVRAMLDEIIADPKVTGGARVLIYWGNRKAEDFYWQPPAGTDVTFIPVLSGSAETWTGRAGHVQNAVIADGVDLSTAAVYACGSPAMIESAQALFAQHGLPDHNYYFDAFVSSASVE